jgi:hypothetical protein
VVAHRIAPARACATRLAVCRARRSSTEPCSPVSYSCCTWPSRGTCCSKRLGRGSVRSAGGGSLHGKKPASDSTSAKQCGVKRFRDPDRTQATRRVPEIVVRFVHRFLKRSVTEFMRCLTNEGAFVPCLTALSKSGCENSSAVAATTASCLCSANRLSSTESCETAIMSASYIPAKNRSRQLVPVIFERQRAGSTVGGTATLPRMAPEEDGHGSTT